MEITLSGCYRKTSKRTLLKKVYAKLNRGDCSICHAQFALFIIHYKKNLPQAEVAPEQVAADTVYLQLTHHQHKYHV